MSIPRVGRLMLAVLAATALLTPATAGSAVASSGMSDDLDATRAATGKYWNVLTAMVEGFTPSTGCESSPAGSLGIRYEHAVRAADAEVDPLRPEALVYLPQGMGAGRRLAAVEYSVPYRGQQPPELFGRRFEGPAPGEARPRYRLRVWLFSENPDGMFAAANPAEACGADSLVARHGTFDRCQETTLTLPAPAARVREVGEVPDELRLVGEETGTALVSVAAFSCRSLTTENGVRVPDFTFLFGYAQLRAPDWAGPDDLATRYPLYMLTKDPRVAASWREGMGSDTSVIAHTAELDGQVTPTLGIGSTVAFSSPELRLDAVTTTPPDAGLPVYPRSFRPGSRGMGHFSVWVRDARSGIATGSLQLRAGTTLARVLGCTPAADPTWCTRKAAAGLNIRFSHAAFRTYAHDLWGPAAD